MRFLQAVNDATLGFVIFTLFGADYSSRPVPCPSWRSCEQKNFLQNFELINFIFFFVEKS